MTSNCSLGLTVMEKVGSSRPPILQMGKLRPREAEPPAQIHAVIVARLRVESFFGAVWCNVRRSSGQQEGSNTSLSEAVRSERGRGPSFLA